MAFDSPAWAGQIRPISASIPHLNLLALMLVFLHTGIN